MLCAFTEAFTVRNEIALPFVSLIRCYPAMSYPPDTCDTVLSVDLPTTNVESSLLGSGAVFPLLTLAVLNQCHFHLVTPGEKVVYPCQEDRRSYLSSETFDAAY